jgi:hypothetical protein
VSLPQVSVVPISEEQMKNPTLYYAILTLISTAIPLIWGLSYRANHPYGAVAAFFGTGSSDYELAGWAAGLGALGFLVGIGMLVAGLVRANPEGGRS